jgi:hypothetical protein
MLLIAAASGDRPYVAIWCEHHEDFLAERPDGAFDAYQIKTSRPELGAWTLHDAELVRSIGRFVELVSEYGSFIRDLYFVSNTEYENSQEGARHGRCPLPFLQHIRGCKSANEIAAAFAMPFARLQAQCGCDPHALFTTLCRLDLIVGPPRNGFEAAVAHEHLAKLPTCVLLTANQLDDVRDRLMALVHGASALQVTDPLRHLHPLISRTELDPSLAEKRLEVASVSFQPSLGLPFRFPGQPDLALGTQRPAQVMEQKLSQGGLQIEDIELMRERERAAEYHLIEDASIRPEAYPALLRQLEQMVLGECTEAHLRARQNLPPYGQAMMIEVQDRLRRLATERSRMVGDRSYECLIGVAGLLTRECRVWWSPRFDISPETDA